MMNQCPDEETVKELDTGISLRKMNAAKRFAEHLSAELSSYSNTANTVFITKIVTLPADDGGFPTMTVTLHSKDRRCFTLPLLRLNSFQVETSEKMAEQLLYTAIWCRIAFSYLSFQLEIGI
jgi:hypothetical protein